MNISFSIPGAPVPKGRPRFTKRGHVYTPKKTAAYEQEVAEAAKAAMHHVPATSDAVSVTVTAVLPVPESWSKKRRAAALEGSVQPTGRPDADNFLKAALDGCNRIVFEDDSQVVEIQARKTYGDKPRLVIHVESVSLKQEAA